MDGEKFIKKVLDRKDMGNAGLAGVDGFLAIPNFICSKHFSLCSVMVNSPEKYKVTITCLECDKED